jgi:hypothetical protein
MSGGHTTTSPDGAWTVSVKDGATSSGENGFTILLYRGSHPVSPADKAPALIFESPLPTFDARSSGTTAEWTKDGSECRMKLATDQGDATLVVFPNQNRVVFSAYDPLQASNSSGYLPGVLLLMTMVACICVYRIKRAGSMKA